MKRTPASGDRFPEGETAPISASAAHAADTKLFSRGFLCTLGLIAVLLIVVFVTPSFFVVYPPRFRNFNNLVFMERVILQYAFEDSDRLPPTLREVTPRYISVDTFTRNRYRDLKTGGQLDWLYFPRSNLNDCQPDTILIAAPRLSYDPSRKQQRLVWKVGSRPWKAEGQPGYIPEADFQRLIHEQNPPAASPPPDRQETVK